MAKDYSEDLLIQKSTAELLEKELGWKRKVDFPGLVKMMVESDMKEIAGMTPAEYIKNNKEK